MTRMKLMNARSSEVFETKPERKESKPEKETERTSLFGEKISKEDQGLFAGLTAGTSF